VRDARFEVFTAMKIRIMVFRVLTPYNNGKGDQRFGGSCCPHLHGEVSLISWTPSVWIFKSYGHLMRTMEYSMLHTNINIPRPVT